MQKRRVERQEDLGKNFVVEVIDYGAGSEDRKGPLIECKKVGCKCPEWE